MILEEEHYCLLCFNKKDNGFDLVDNNDVGTMQKYNGTLDKIVSLIIYSTLLKI